MEAGSTTALAATLAAALVLSGAAAVIAQDDAPAQATMPTVDRAEGADQTTPAKTIEWEGQVATTLCAPSGPYSCTGAQAPNADDRLDTRLKGHVSWTELTLTWEARTPATMELHFAVASGHTACDGRCTYWQSLDWVQGTSPLTIQAEDLDIEEGDTLWILVDTPDRAPTDELYAKATLEQPFLVTGTLVPGDPPQQEASV